MKRLITPTALCLLTFFGTLSLSAQAQSELKIVDLSKKEVRVFNAAQKLPDEARLNLIMDSLFIPYTQFWSSYLGSEKKFLRWVKKDVYPNLEKLNELNDTLNREAVLKIVSADKRRKRDSIVYVVFGPGCTDVGRFQDGTEVVDLMHEKYSALNR